jgi:hypothetical protein
MKHKDHEGRSVKGDERATKTNLFYSILLREKKSHVSI